MPGKHLYTIYKDGLDLARQGRDCMSSKSDSFDFREKHDFQALRNEVPRKKQRLNDRKNKPWRGAWFQLMHWF